MSEKITAKMVADLRAATGLGMMECKKALVQADGNMEKAEEVLRINSGAKAGKLASRVAAEGMIAAYIEGNIGTLVEVNCETDFVAKDESFKHFANEVAAVVAKNNPRDIDSLNNQIATTGKTIEEDRKALIAKLGENISIRRFKRVEGEHPLTVYLHGTRIGVMVAYEGDQEVARSVAMHIASARPQNISSDQVDPKVIEKERHIYEEQAAQSGKPAAIVAKMVDGKVKKFLAEITLLGQAFVKNPDQTVQAYLQENKTQIFDFIDLHVGEGIEKKTVDYAAEVAAAAKV